MSAPAAQEERKATLRDWMAVIGATLGGFMAVLDIVISAASMKDIQGSISASLDEAAWISTSYLISEIIVIPLTGWLVSIFSLRRFLLVNSVLFVLFSIWCGASTSLPMLVVARFFQGLTGGALIPVGAMTVVRVLPPSQRTLGFVIFGLCSALAPAIGPTLGGFITSAYGWPMSYYINLFPGIVFIWMIAYGLKPEPMNLGGLKNGDWTGIFTMTVTMATMTYVLEEGNRKEWFADPSILWCTVACVISTVVFLWNEMRVKNPVIHLRLFLRRNFLAANMAVFFVGIFMYSYTYIIPHYLLQVQGYDAFEAGKVMMWFSLPQLALAPFIPFLVKTMNRRMMICVGFCTFIASCYLNSFMDLNFAGDQLIWSQLIRAVGIGLVLTPLNTLAFEGIEVERVGSASAIFTVMRNLGGSIGISFFSTFLTVRHQTHFVETTEAVSVQDPGVQQGLQQLIETLQLKSSALGEHQAVQYVAKLINRESLIMAYSDLFMCLGFFMIIALCTVPFIQNTAGVPKPAPPGTDH